MIEEYKFGLIIILGKTYEYDVEVRWDGKVLEWWRKESHIIDIESLKRAIEQNPELIVVGTGEPGLAKITDNAKKEILSKGIGLIVDETTEAIKVFNAEVKNKKVIGLFHLTC